MPNTEVLVSHKFCKKEEF